MAWVRYYIQPRSTLLSSVATVRHVEMIICNQKFVNPIAEFSWEGEEVRLCLLGYCRVDCLCS